MDDCGRIDRLHGQRLPYADFFRSFLFGDKKEHLLHYERLPLSASVSFLYNNALRRVYRRALVFILR